MCILFQITACIARVIECDGAVFGGGVVVGLGVGRMEEGEGGGTNSSDSSGPSRCTSDT